MKIVTATVRFPAGKEFEGKFGKRQNVKFVTDGGTDADIWFNAGDRRYVNLRKGETVELLQEGERFTLITPDEAEEPTAHPAAPPVPETPTAPPSQTPQFQEMCRRALMLRSCHVQMITLFTDATGQCILSEETIQKYATTLYIDIVKNR